MNDKEKRHLNRDKKKFFEKVNSVFESIGDLIDKGEKPIDELAWLEGLLAQTIQDKKWVELTLEERRRFLSILRSLNLYREEMNSGEPIGVNPVGEDPELIRAKIKDELGIPDDFDPDRYHDYDPRHK